MKPVINRLKQCVPGLKKLYVDSGYDGAPFQAWSKTTHDVDIQVVLRPDAGITLIDGIAVLPTGTPTDEQFRLAAQLTRQGYKGFQVVEKRWVVERTFAWLLTFRRLKVDYEERIDVSEGFIYAAMSSILLHRLCA